MDKIYSCKGIDGMYGIFVEIPQKELLSTNIPCPKCNENLKHENSSQHFLTNKIKSLKEEIQKLGNHLKIKLVNLQAELNDMEYEIDNTLSHLLLSSTINKEKDNV